MNKGNFKNKLNNIFKKAKSFCIKYKKLVVVTIIVLIILIIILAIIKKNHKKDGLLYGQVTEIKIEEIENLYKYVDDISCVGGLSFDLQVGYDTQSIDKVSKKALLNYLFSYLDKNNLLSDEMSKSFINEKTRELFYDKDLSLFNSINNFQYGDYAYIVEGNTVKRLKKKCENKITYVSKLFGYTSDEEIVSMDVDLGRLVDGVLYDMAGNKLGDYSSSNEKLSELFANAPYYRYNYIKVNGLYKLQSVGLISRQIQRN